jgi:hypothetical protein
MVTRPEHAIAVEEEDLDRQRLSERFTGLSGEETDIEPIEELGDGFLVAGEILGRRHGYTKSRSKGRKR